MAVSKQKREENIAETLQRLVDKGQLIEAEQVFQSCGGVDQAGPGLVSRYAAILINNGLYTDAEQLLVHRLQSEPQDFSLLHTLGSLDEKRGQNLNAFDLYQRAEFAASSPREKKKIMARKMKVKENMKARTAFGKENYKIRLEGNEKPLELEYSLNLLARRKRLLDAILATIDPNTETVLEIECDAGIISKNLTDHGFKVEGTAAKMEHILLAMGFEYLEILRMIGVPSPGYYHADLSAAGAETIEKRDVIMVLPALEEWYVRRGSAGAAAILRKLYGRAKRQLYFYIPPDGEEAPPGGMAAAVLEELKKCEELPGEPVLCFKGERGGYLYRFDRRQAAPGDLSKVLPRGLEVVGSRSHIFEADLEKCRSLNGFGYTGQAWDHFAATLKEVLENPEITYEESTLRRFYEAFQPQNRKDHYFGEEKGDLAPLDRGWTLLPWMETKNRQLNPVKSPESRPGGNHHYGPNTDDFGSREFGKLKKTYRMIGKRGYLPEIFPDGYILGYILKDGDDYRLLICEGQHRAAVMGLLGYETCKVKFSPDQLPVVDIKHIDKWAQVKSGLYTKELAEKAFRYYFEEDGRRKARTLGLL